jgi:hypothetical protein
MIHECIQSVLDKLYAMCDLHLVHRLGFSVLFENCVASENHKVPL